MFEYRGCFDHETTKLFGNKTNVFANLDDEIDVFHYERASQPCIALGKMRLGGLSTNILLRLVRRKKILMIGRAVVAGFSILIGHLSGSSRLHLLREGIAGGLSWKRKTVEAARASITSASRIHTLIGQPKRSLQQRSDEIDVDDDSMLYVDDDSSDWWWEDNCR
jgi:hypothetical protein